MGKKGMSNEHRGNGHTGRESVHMELVTIQGISKQEIVINLH